MVKNDLEIYICNSCRKLYVSPTSPQECFECGNEKFSRIPNSTNAGQRSVVKARAHKNVKT